MKTFLLFVACVVSLAGISSAEAKALKLRNTYYYVVIESEYAHYPVDAQIRTMSGKVLAEVSHQFKKAVDIEGTGKLRDGRVINYAGRVEGEIRYLISKAPHGYGVGTCKLVPFHSAAVDPKVVPLGSLLYIKETAGMVLPDGTRHNGLWRAEDIGSAIKGDRIDLFVGEGDRGDILKGARIKNLMPLTAEILRGKMPRSCVDKK